MIICPGPQFSMFEAAGRSVGRGKGVSLGGHVLITPPSLSHLFYRAPALTPADILTQISYCFCKAQLPVLAQNSQLPESACLPLRSEFHSDSVAAAISPPVTPLQGFGCDSASRTVPRASACGCVLLAVSPQRGFCFHILPPQVAQEEHIKTTYLKLELFS